MGNHINGSGKEPERRTNITSLEEVRKRAEAETKAKMRAAQAPKVWRERLIGLLLIGLAVGTIVAWLAPMLGAGVAKR